MSDLRIRNATMADLGTLVEISNYYIAHSHATFETTLSSVDEKQDWFAEYGMGRHQILVAEDSGKIVGCAYSSRYRARPAFDTTVETSVYLVPDEQKRGIGTALYTVLFARLSEQSVHLAVAGIALPNEASIALHRKFGFEEVGTFREYAMKNGEWTSSTWFQKRINNIDHTT